MTDIQGMCVTYVQLSKVRPLLNIFFSIFPWSPICPFSLTRLIKTDRFAYSPFIWRQNPELTFFPTDPWVLLF